MARTLSSRLGGSEDDSVVGFERASRRNFRDAEQLRAAGRRLGAIYLYGYSVEMLVKAAYFRMDFMASQPARPLGTTKIDGHRRQAAVRETDSQGNRLVPNVGPHDISRWTTLLIRRRALLSATNRAVAYAPALATDLQNRADRVYDHWKEYMRYRAVAVRVGELAIVRGDAIWFRGAYPQL